MSSTQQPDIHHFCTNTKHFITYVAPPHQKNHVNDYIFPPHLSVKSPWHYNTIITLLPTHPHHTLFVTLHHHYHTFDCTLTAHFHVTYQILEHFPGHTHTTLLSHFTPSALQHHLIGLSAHSLHKQWISPTTPTTRKISSSTTRPWWMHSMFRIPVVRLSSDSWLSATLSCLKKKMVNLSVTCPNKMNMEIYKCHVDDI